MLDKGVEGWVSMNTTITLINESIKIRKTGRKGFTIAFKDVVYGITTAGLYYPLCNAKWK